MKVVSGKRTVYNAGTSESLESPVSTRGLHLIKILTITREWALSSFRSPERLSRTLFQVLVDNFSSFGNGREETDTSLKVFSIQELLKPKEKED